MNKLILQYILILSALTVSIFGCDVQKFNISECTADNGFIFASANHTVASIDYRIAAGQDGIVKQYDNQSGTCDGIVIQSNTTEDLYSIDTRSICGTFTYDYVLIVGANGTILHGLIDTDPTLNIIESGTSNDLLCVKYLKYSSGRTDNCVAIAVGENGTILKSTDVGDSWYPVSSGTTENLRTIYYNNGITYVSGTNGAFLSSTDDGETWYSQEPIGGGSLSSGTVDIYSINFADHSQGWAAGSDGKIFKTTNYGISWTLQNSGITNKINQISFNTYLGGFAVSDGGRVIYTTNGGTNWYPHPIFDTLTTRDITTFLQSDSVSFSMMGDSVFFNLTTETPVKPLSGVIPIGQNEDITTLNEAFERAAYLGIKDSVTFDLQPGNYFESVETKPVYPSEAKIRIRGNGNTVFSRDTSGNLNYVFKLKGAKNILIENLTIAGTDTNYGRLVLFEGQTSNVTFNNVKFNGPVSLANNVNNSLVMNEPPPNTTIMGLNFNHCEFNNGPCGIRLFSNSSYPYSGLKISNCVFNNSVYNSITLNFHANTEITENTFYNVGNAISLSNSQLFEVSRNYVTGKQSGIILNATSGFLFSSNKVINNFIICPTTGIFLVSSNTNLNLSFNSVNIVDTSDTTSVPDSYPLQTFFFSGSGVNIKNNIFMNRRKGYAFGFSYSGGNPINSLNHNIYFSEGMNSFSWQGINHSNISAYKSASNRDSNSYFSEIDFAGNTDLHLTSLSDGDTLLKAVPVAGVINDYDGDIRNPTIPYKGADEGTIPFEFKKLKLKINFEALTVLDTITVQLRNYFSPFETVQSVKGITGFGIEKEFSISGLSYFTPYYIVIKHRNSIETWSGYSPSFLSDSLEFDFTIGDWQAYGNNQVFAGSLWSVYSGDVNQDGIVEASDISAIDNAASGFLKGYVSTDLNGDGIVEGADAVIAENNAANFVSVIRP